MNRCASRQIHKLAIFAADLKGCAAVDGGVSIYINSERYT